MYLFWLCYRYDGRFRGAVAIEAGSLAHARVKAAVLGLDPGCECEGHILDAASARLIPKRIIGRLLDEAELRRLRRIVAPKKPPAPSVRKIKAKAPRQAHGAR